MKALNSTTPNDFFNAVGKLTHAGDYAGEFRSNAIDILDSVSDEKDEIWKSPEAWADIMVDATTGEVYAVWASGSLTSQNDVLEYVQLDEQEEHKYPEVFRKAADKEI